MNFDSYYDTMQQMLVVDPTNTEFPNIFPSIINDAELRIYREFDFLTTLASQTTTLTALTRNVALPANVIVAESMNVVTPSTTTNPDLGTRNPLQRVSIDSINALWPSVTGATVPTYYALIGLPTIGASLITASAVRVLLGPAPDAAYTLEVIGTVRPTPISEANPTTFISVNMPDLFVAASMVFGAAYQQNFGAQSDNPQMAMSWENHYQALKAGVNMEELRKKAESADWTPFQPSPIADSKRGG